MKKINEFLQKVTETEEYTQEDLEELYPLIPELKELWNTYSEQENDTRGGYETYGYESYEDILYNLIYISDRWGSAFRIKWLLNGLEYKEFEVKLNEKPI